MTTTLLSLGALTVAAYQVRTGDTTSAASSVSAALIEGEGIVEDELRRLLPLDSRDESMVIRAEGRMYPKAWPLVSCATNTIDGRMLLGGVPDLEQFIIMVGADSSITPRATVTYTGGFDADTLPPTLANAIYALAHVLVGAASPVPVGATAMSVGDVSVSFGAPVSGGLDAYVPGLSDRLRKYRNRWV